MRQFEQSDKAVCDTSSKCKIKLGISERQAKWLCDKSIYTYIGVHRKHYLKRYLHYNRCTRLLFSPDYYTPFERFPPFYFSDFVCLPLEAMWWYANAINVDLEMCASTAKSNFARPTNLNNIFRWAAKKSNDIYMYKTALEWGFEQVHGHVYQWVFVNRFCSTVSGLRFNPLLLASHDRDIFDF